MSVGPSGERRLVCGAPGATALDRLEWGRHQLELDGRRPAAVWVSAEVAAGLERKVRLALAAGLPVTMMGMAVHLGAPPGFDFAFTWEE